MKTLDELKAENVKIEEESNNASVAELEETEVEAVEEETPEAVNLAEDEQKEGEETETEAWMQTDEESSSDNEKKFTDHDIAAAKKKLKARVSNQSSEIDELKTQVAQLKQGTVTKTEAPNLNMPLLSEYDYDEELHAKAIGEWHNKLISSKVDASNQQAQVTAQEAQQLSERNKSVDSHYQRAVVLSEKSGIKPDDFRESELKVRQAMDSLVHGKGDDMVDNIISTLGEGSEKVMYYLGRNPDALDKMVNLARGNAFAMMMEFGNLKAKLTATKNNISTARKPTKKISGDEKGGSVTSFKKRYDKAKTPQERLNIKWAAKAEKVSTAGW